MGTETHVVRSVELASRRILEQHALEAQDLQYGRLGLGRERVDLQIVDVVISNDILEDGVELVEDFDPISEVGPWPPPFRNLSNNSCEIVRLRLC